MEGAFEGGGGNVSSNAEFFLALFFLHQHSHPIDLLMRATMCSTSK
jgi:hypothetical protein